MSTSPDIFHIAVYHIEYIDNFIYSALQKGTAQAGEDQDLEVYCTLD